MIVIVTMLMIIFNCALGPRHLTKVMFNTDNEDHEEDCYDCNCALGSSILPRWFLTLMMEITEKIVIIAIVLQGTTVVQDISQWEQGGHESWLQVRFL